MTETREQFIRRCMWKLWERVDEIMHACYVPEGEPAREHWRRIDAASVPLNEVAAAYEDGKATKQQVYAAGTAWLDFWREERQRLEALVPEPGPEPGPERTSETPPHPDHPSEENNPHNANTGAVEEQASFGLDDARPPRKVYYD